MRVILYIIVLIVIVSIIMYILNCDCYQKQGSLETFRDVDESLSGKTEAVIYLQCIGNFMIFVDGQMVLINMKTNPGQVFKKKIYLFSSSDIKIAIQNTLNNTGGFIGGIVIGQNSYPFHLGKGGGGISCQGELEKTADVSSSHSKQFSEFSGGKYLGCYLLPDDILTVGRYGNYHKTMLDGSLENQGTIAKAHMISVENKDKFFGVMTDEKKQVWCISGNVPLGNLTSNVAENMCTSRCPDTQGEMCGGVRSMNGKNSYYAQTYQTNQAPTAVEVTDDKIKNMTSDSLPHGEQWIWINTGPSGHYSKNFWLFNIENPIESTDMVCIYPQYYEFVPTACGDPTTAERCSQTLRPGFKSDVNKCRKHYRPPTYYDTYVWKTTFMRAIHNLLDSHNTDIFTNGKEIKIVFTDIFQELFNLHIQILQHAGHDKTATVLNSMINDQTLQDRCDIVDPQNREQVPYNEPGLNLCSVPGSPECDMLRTRCIEDGNCFDDTQIYAPKCFKPAEKINDYIIDLKIIPHFNKSLTMVAKLSETKLMGNSPLMVRWKELMIEFVKFVRILEFMSSKTKCNCIAESEELCYPC